MRSRFEALAAPPNQLEEEQDGEDPQHPTHAGVIDEPDEGEHAVAPERHG
jgi:hypothetical protein